MISNNSSIASERVPFATYFLVALNTLVFFATQSAMSTQSLSEQTLIEFGALQPLLLWKGEIWRLVSAEFVHASFFHYAFNTFVLMQIGRVFEPVIGSVRLLLLYFMSGVAGFALSVLVYSQLTLGASGAVFGLFGGMLGVFLNLPRNRIDSKLMRSLILIIALNLGFGMLLEKVDSAAHIGGLIFGFLLGFSLFAETTLFQSCPLEFKKKRQKIASFVLFATLLTSFALVTFSMRPVFLSSYHEALAFDAIRSKDDVSAEREVKWLTRDGRPANPLAFILASRLATHQGNVAKAQNMAAAALKMDKDLKFWRPQIAEHLFVDETGSAVLCQVLLETKVSDVEVLNDCAWLLLVARETSVRDAKTALAWATRATNSGGKVPAAVFHTLAEAYLQNGKQGEAMHAIERGLLQHDASADEELRALQARAQATLTPIARHNK